MIYNLNNPIEQQKFLHKVDTLTKKGGFVELTQKQAPKTENQNSYAHLLMRYFACQYGSTLDYVKLHYFKLACNRDIFVTKVQDELLGEIQTIRSIGTLSKDELTTAIERFKVWSLDTAGIYLPNAEERDYLLYAEQQSNNYKNYL